MVEDIGFCKHIFMQWIHETVDAWVDEYEAWDMFFEDNEDFTEEDWEYIKENLTFNVTIREKGEEK